MKKNNFKPYKVGTVFNKLEQIIANNIKPVFKSIEIKYPSRLNAMALDPSKIASNDNLHYSPGEIIFKVKIYKKVKVSVIPNSEIIISNGSNRKSLIMHSAILMRKALKVKHGFFIDVDNQNEIRHAGLGSSSGLISAVACAINETYGNPIKTDNLLKYLAQNHGEETGNDNFLSPVQCIGGSAAAGLYDGALIILAGENKVILNNNIDSNYRVVIGIPNDFKELNADILLNKEIKNFPKFIRTGKVYGPEIAYRLLHKVLPALKENNLEELGDLIFDYRFKMGSIKNCSYVYPKLTQLAKKLEFLKTQGMVDVLSISSVGPAFFAITYDTVKCTAVFKRLNLNTFVADIDNSKYKILRKKN